MLEYILLDQVNSNAVFNEIDFVLRVLCVACTCVL